MAKIEIDDLLSIETPNKKIRFDGGYTNYDSAAQLSEYCSSKTKSAIVAL